MLRAGNLWRGLLLFAVVAGAAYAVEDMSSSRRSAVLLEIDGAIGPVTVEYFRDGLRKARERDAPLVLLRIDTPGGLDAAMRDIVKEILASPLPVVGFVAPGGARAASAGTYILYACHVAAMAPATNLGSATPVQIGGLPGLPDGADQPTPEPGEADGGRKPADHGQRPVSGGAMQRKIVNDAAAFLRGLAVLRGRNAEWAEQAVREAGNLTADEALQRGVIDLVAADVPRLLAQIDGRELSLPGGTTTLRTNGLEIETFAPDWRIRILSAITDPNIAYVLMLIGIYGLIYELANPGAILPGVIGAIALLTALYAFQALPVNYAGLALLALGVAFMVLEAFVPSFGALGIGGAIAFVVGSLILYRDEAGQIGVAIPLIATFVALSMALFLGVLGYALKTRRRPVVSGREEMLGATGVAEQDFADTGRVWVHSESWTATTRAPLRQGQRVRVIAIQGLRLEVEPLLGTAEDQES